MAANPRDPGRGFLHKESRWTWAGASFIKYSLPRGIRVPAIREALGIRRWGTGGRGAVLSGLDELRQGSVKDAAFERQPWGVNRVTNTSAFSHFERSLSPPIRREGGGRRFWSVAPSACSPAHPRCPVPPQFLKHLAGKQFPPRMVLPGHSQARKGDRAGLPPSTSLLPCSS